MLSHQSSLGFQQLDEKMLNR